MGHFPNCCAGPINSYKSVDNPLFRDVQKIFCSLRTAMMMQQWIGFWLLFLSSCLCCCHGWEATWESLDSRPLPSWYDEAKFGIFLHWGVFSVPAFGHTAWFWFWWQQQLPEYQEYVQKTQKQRFAYPDYAQDFTAELYDATAWANLLAESGAQYVVLTSKHHEGFCNWDSTDIPWTRHWNAMDVGPRRDILGELNKAVKNTTSPHTDRPLRFGIYHSMLEFYNPLYERDGRNQWKTHDFVTHKAHPELYDLVRRYEPHLLWSDGTWDTTSEYWKATEFLAWYATESTVADEAVWNDRWGTDCLSQHGGFYTPSDRYNPGQLIGHKWEDALTLNTFSWGDDKNATIGDYLTTTELIHTLIENVAFGGNMLLNLGPGADGTIKPIFADRLKGMGEWLRVNGDAIYATQPWTVAQNETSSSCYYTTKTTTTTTKKKNKTLYVIMTRWPTDSTLRLRHPVVQTNVTTISMLGVHKPRRVEWEPATANGTGLVVHLPKLTPNRIPCKHAWVLALQGIVNL